MAAVELTAARAGSPRATWERDFPERTWPDDDHRWVLLRDALALIEDLNDLEEGRWGPREAAIEAGRAVCVLTDHVLFAFDAPGAGEDAPLRDYALSRQAVATITKSLDALLEAAR